MAIKIPAYIPFMAVATAAYLTVEIPFSVHLVEVLGGAPDQDDIDRMESFGRVLTGIAVSIWIVGALVFPRMHAKGRSFLAAAVAAAVVTAVSTSATYMALDMIATSTGHGADGAERKEAFMSNLARRHISENGGSGDLVASGLNDWNTFIAVAPSLSSSGAMAEAAGVPAEELARGEARRLVGEADEFRAAVFGEGYDRVRRSYESYAEGSADYLDARRNLQRDAGRAWDEFQAELHKRYPDGLPGQGWTHASIVRHVKFKMGIPVHGNWRIHDRAGFVGPYMKVASEKIEKAYRDQVEARLGSGERLAPGLDLDGFASHPAVQKDIRRALDLPAGGRPVIPGMSDKDFRETVYGPKLAAVARELSMAAAAPASEFASGDYVRHGVDAVKSARLPAMAILLSIAGAALHIFKLSGYLAQIAGHAASVRTLARGRSRHVFAAAVTAAAFAWMSMSGNAVTETEAFGKVRAEGAYASLLEGAISIQPEFSQIGALIGSVGGWQAFAADMPAPVHAAARNRSAETAQAGPAPSGIVLPDVSRIPIPVFRDAN